MSQIPFLGGNQCGSIVVDFCFLFNLVISFLFFHKVLIWDVIFWSQKAKFSAEVTPLVSVLVCARGEEFKKWFRLNFLLPPLKRRLSHWEKTGQCYPLSCSWALSGRCWHHRSEWSIRMDGSRLGLSLCSVINAFISRGVTREITLDMLLSNANYLLELPKISQYFVDVSAETHTRDQDCYGLDG